MTNAKDDPEYDEFCDPDNPRKVNYDGILAASRRIIGQVVRTPCMKAHMSKRLGMDLYLKAEFLQITGCFKERGVCNTLLLLSEEQKKYGVVAASTGNHACALAYHSTQMEIIEQVPNVDAVLCPCGGGSLLAGVALAVKHLKPDTEVYVNKTYSMVEALRKNERIFLTLEPTIADGLAVNKVGVNTFYNLKGVLDKMVVVREDWVARAIMTVIEEEKVVVEGAGAVCVASIMAGLFPNLKGKRVVAICSGGNIDSTTLTRALERGMAADGRLMKFKDLEYDPNCDPDNPRKIKYEDILAAYQRMVGQVIRTQCPRAHMSKKLGVELYMKQEFLQYSGCFKERGIYNALVLLSDEQKKLGVITSSSGNSGIAMALNCSKLGIPCSVVMPFKASIFKRTLAERLGAKIILHGKDMADSKRHAMMLARERKLTYINCFDHPHIIEGDGTIGIEIIDQLPDVDAVLVPCGGGSLLTGVAIAVKHLKPDTEVYGVETDKSCSMMEALKKNERVFVPIDSTIADALAVNKVGVNTFFSLKGMVDKMVVVKEDWVARAIMHIVEEEKFAVEGGGAVGVAALMAGLFPNLRGKKVVTICTGGNMDTTTLGRALERGMAAEGRLLKFKVSVSDRPTGIADLCTMLAGIGASVRDCVPERACVKGDVTKIQASNISCITSRSKPLWKVIVETRGWDHTKELVDLIKKNFKEYLFAESTENPERTVSVKRGPCLAPNPVCMQK
ncbi:hypothetical protein HF086_014154 [Spodoptera exigua]|uniref:L-serine deaminase n=1 Tax=Spodoptera exigua TaxID=7107 RepID=A0A922SIW7_SPOEX|nr:hypothetical protein HF086_014154 [Spodoptera exigua]